MVQLVVVVAAFVDKSMSTIVLVEMAGVKIVALYYLLYFYSLLCSLFSDIFNVLHCSLLLQ